MNWGKKSFSILPDGGGAKLCANEFSDGNIVNISGAGVYRYCSVDPKVGFDLDSAGRIKFFRGSIGPSSLSSYLSSGLCLVSEYKFSNRAIGLYFSYSDQQIAIVSSYPVILILDRRGAFRVSGRSSEKIGIPVDSQGRVRVLK